MILWDLITKHVLLLGEIKLRLRWLVLSKQTNNLDKARLEPCPQITIQPAVTAKMVIITLASDAMYLHQLSPAKL